MEPLFEPTAHPVLEADHVKRHAIKDALVELIAEQPPLNAKSAQRHHGWKLEKLLLAKGYAIVPAASLAPPVEGSVGEMPQDLQKAVVAAAKRKGWHFDEEDWLDTENDGTLESDCVKIAYSLGRADGHIAAATTPVGEDVVGEWKRLHYPEEEMPTELGMYAVGANGRTYSREWRGTTFVDELGYACHPEFFFSQPLPTSPSTQSTLENIISQKAASFTGPLTEKEPRHA